jgi:hypothetical protein
MREIRPSGSEGGVGFYPPFLPLLSLLLLVPEGSGTRTRAGTGASRFRIYFTHGCVVAEPVIVGGSGVA